MFLTSQVIERNQDQLDQRLPTLVVNPPSDQLLAQLELPGRVWTWDYAGFRQLQQQGIGHLEFAPLPDPRQTFGQALVFMSKSQAEFELAWRIACSRLEPGARILLVGEKREGIANAAKRLQKRGCTLLKLDSARHCQLWEARDPEAGTPWDLEGAYQHFDLDCGGRTLRIYSLPGVFGVGRLDEGTRLLLDQIQEVPAGRLLDFGCGSGVIGAWLKARQPQAEVHLVDTHALALESARRTLRENQLEGQVYPSDGLAEAKGPFRAIVTNPPFHAGVKTDYRATLGMIRDARAHLKPGGELWLVANAFLPYPELIQDVFGNCRVLAKTSRFAVYHAERTK